MYDTFSGSCNLLWLLLNEETAAVTRDLDVIVAVRMVTITINF